MGLFTLPPSSPRADLDIEAFLRGDQNEAIIRKFKRTMAAEWFPQSGVQLTWPHENTDWKDNIREITDLYIRLAYEIACREILLIVTPEVARTRDLLKEKLPNKAFKNIIYSEISTNDTWARDHAFITVINNGKNDLLDFRFNGWGGKYFADSDNAINKKLFENGIVYGNYINYLDFELEGGSIETDGCGSLLTTKRCLLNENRNAQFSQKQIEDILCERLGVENFLWLEHGFLAGDDTDSHIDTLARLCPGNKILYVQCNDSNDEHYEELRLMEEELRQFRNIENEPFELIALPFPTSIIDNGNRLPATYANYLVMNKTVLFPTYNQPYIDEQASKAIQKAFPGYDVVGINCCALIKQHGSLHCATMQYPKGVLKLKNEILR